MKEPRAMFRTGKPMRKGKRFGGYDGDAKGLRRYWNRKARRQNNLIAIEEAF